MSREFPDTRDPNRPIVTFGTGVELSAGCLETFPELAAALIDTKPATFNNAVHITSADDSNHGKDDGGSFHYVGAGYDVRFVGSRHGGIVVPGMETPGDTPEAQKKYADRQAKLADWWAARLAMRLRGRWQIVREKDHIHAERDPGR